MIDRIAWFGSTSLPGSLLYNQPVSWNPHRLDELAHVTHLTWAGSETLIGSFVTMVVSMNNHPCPATNIEKPTTASVVKPEVQVDDLPWPNIPYYPS